MLDPLTFQSEYHSSHSPLLFKLECLAVMFVIASNWKVCRYPTLTRVGHLGLLLLCVAVSGSKLGTAMALWKNLGLVLCSSCKGVWH